MAISQSTAVIGAVKAASLEEDGNRVDNSTCSAITVGTDGYWFIIEPLPSFESAVAGTALVVVNRQPKPHIKSAPFRRPLLIIRLVSTLGRRLLTKTNLAPSPSPVKTTLTLAFCICLW